MHPAGLLLDAFERIREVTQVAVAGLDAEQLNYRVDPGANSIGWLVWHLTRIQDDHVAGAAGAEQVWRAGWAERFALGLDESDTGYGHGPDDVARVRVDSAALLTGYHDAVYSRTAGYLQGLTDPDLDRIVDRSWDPPVTLAVRLISVISDDLQHAGQAAFVRGLLRRRAG